MSCSSCRHFDNAAGALEAAFPGLASLSSGYAAVRSNDGLCALHERYVPAESVCARHTDTGRPVARTVLRTRRLERFDFDQAIVE